eukprot:TRINITY_DN5184_c0_g2_i1.p1 TRINITY_DN5184_c0_g2~~TRINITY_DN5184_c0_g2_i1.p1  ORF type:complete len:589 (+),score=198.43 TRINITY_DN5184_c0_g2_i1:81-1847(+)
MASRVDVLRTHLSADVEAASAAPAAAQKATGAAAALRKVAMSLSAGRDVTDAAPRQRPNGSWSWRGVTDFFAHQDKMEEVPDTAGVLEKLPGPMRDTQRYPGGREEVVRALVEQERIGQGHVNITRMQALYGRDGLRSNLAVPVVSFAQTRPPLRTHQVLVADPRDCGRLAAAHVKKQPNFTIFLLNSVLSTTDVDHWRRQRQGLTEAFIPRRSLAHIFPVSVKRAQDAADRLGRLAGPSGGTPVDMSEFMLHEALAQLLLALFGFEEEWAEANNKAFRDAMAAKSDVQFIARFFPELLAKLKDEKHVSPSEAAETGCPVRGPLSRLIETTTPDDDVMTKAGNAVIFSFAGHDTTGHTMTWMVFELAKNPAVQRRLQAEVDALAAALRKEGRELAYEDLPRMPYLTRCITETLRLWPAVPNGTYRELEHDDWVHGENGERVHLPKGTFVQLLNWSRHRNPALWGPDVDTYNPDREFSSDELWGGRSFAARNPSTERFSPFTYAPRDCIGRNFSQMEMRTIMFNLLQRCTFELAPPTDSHDPANYLGVNYATLGPQDLGGEPQQPPPRKPLGKAMQRVPVGLHLFARPR